MKITSFTPMIVTKDSQAMIEAFEAIGFSTTHIKSDVEGLDVADTHMKDENGNYVDVVQANVERDMNLIRINVDNLEEAIKTFEAKGFKKLAGKIEHTATSIACSLIAPTGLVIDVCEHLK